MIDRHRKTGSGAPDFASAQAMRASPAAEQIPPQDSASRNGRVIGWFGRWRRPIRSWFSRAVPRIEVDDLSQEVFLRLLRYGDDIAVENPQGYLFRIAANVASEWRDRSRARQPPNQSWLNELHIGPASQPDNSVFQSRISKQLHSAVGKLPKRQREVLLLHVNEGLTYKQIAARLDITHLIVLRDLTRAYGALRSQLKNEDL